MNKQITILLIITMVLIAGCNNVNFDEQKEQTQQLNEDTICINKDNITNFCEQERLKVLSEMAINGQTLNESDFDYVITEGDLLSLNVTAIDPDGDFVTYIFTKPIDEQGFWQTQKGDAGVYMTKVYASDGTETIEENVTIFIKRKNNPPIISINDTVYFNEGEKMKLPFKITDDDGDEVVYSISGWPYGSTYFLDYDSAGIYNITISANDGKDKVFKNVNVIINDVNRLPIITFAKTTTITEGKKIIVRPNVTDPDGDKTTITFASPLDEKGEWITKKGDEGEYVIKITAQDKNDNVTQSFKLIVLPSNKAPILEFVKDVVVEEGDLIKFNPIAYDPEGQNVTITYSGWMDKNKYQTNYDDAGEYIVTITASDGEEKQFQHVKVTVLNKNRPPVFID